MKANDRESYVKDLEREIKFLTAHRDNLLSHLSSVVKMYDVQSNKINQLRSTVYNLRKACGLDPTLAEDSLTTEELAFLKENGK